MRLNFYHLRTPSFVFLCTYKAWYTNRKQVAPSILLTLKIMAVFMSIIILGKFF